MNEWLQLITAEWILQNPDYAGLDLILKQVKNVGRTGTIRLGKWSIVYNENKEQKYLWKLQYKKGSEWIDICYLVNAECKTGVVWALQFYHSTVETAYTLKDILAYKANIVLPIDVKYRFGRHDRKEIL